jgi:hypothetical protein
VHTYIGIFFASFAYIWLRAFQQRNVANAIYWWIVPTSYLMAATDVFLIANFAKGLTVALWATYGTAGALGSLTAVYVHKRIVK